MTSKHNLQPETNFYYFLKLLCVRSVNQSTEKSQKKKKKKKKKNAHLSSYLENFCLKIIPVFY